MKAAPKVTREPKEDGAETQAVTPAMRVDSSLTPALTDTEKVGLAGLGRSGFARRARLQAAGSLASQQAPTSPAYEQEPYEQDGFGD